MVLEIEPRVLQMLSKYSTNWIPSPYFDFWIWSSSKIATTCGVILCWDTGLLQCVPAPSQPHQHEEESVPTPQCIVCLTCAAQGKLRMISWWHISSQSPWATSLLSGRRAAPTDLGLLSSDAYYLEIMEPAPFSWRTQLKRADFEERQPPFSSSFL